MCDILSELGIRPGVTADQKKSEKEANDKLDKAQLDDQIQRVKELQESLKLQQLQLAVASARERFQANDTALSSARSLAQAASNVIILFYSFIEY
jgi:hypothetical protein